MVDNQESIEVPDQETGGTFSLNASKLVSDVRNVLISQRKLQVQAKTWKDLTENEQASEIEKMTNLSYDLVESIVGAVAAAGNPVIHANLDHFKVKDGKISVVMTGTADDRILLDMNSTGKKMLKISVADVDAFDEERDFLAPEADQPALPMDQEEGEDLYEKALAIIREDLKCSTSYIQRRLSIGYNAAARIIEDLEQNGVVTAADKVGKRLIVGYNDQPDDDNDGDDLDDMADAMDADLEQMEDDDDLHAHAADGEAEQAPDAETTDEPVDDEKQPDDQFADDETEEPNVRGQKAFMRGAGPDSNPFDGGTVQHLAWAKNYDHAKSAMQALYEEGFTSGADGLTRRSSPYEKGTAKYLGWDKGFVDGKAARAEKEKQNATPEPEVEAEESTAGDENDNFKSGWEAAFAGKGADANPHQPGMTKHRLWQEGLEKAKAEIANEKETG